MGVKSWKNADNKKARVDPTQTKTVPVSNPAVILRTAAEVPKPAVAVAAVESVVIDSAQEIAGQYMTHILTSLDNDPEWRVCIGEDIPGEISALRSIIDGHNRAGRIPRVQYGMHEGIFWAGSSEEIQEETQEVIPVSRPAVVSQTQHKTARPRQTATQLPQKAALAMPRVVQVGKTPTVPADPVRSANTLGRRASESIPNTPAWG